MRRLFKLEGKVRNLQRQIDHMDIPWIFRRADLAVVPDDCKMVVLFVDCELARDTHQAIEKYLSKRLKKEVIVLHLGLRGVCCS